MLHRCTIATADLADILRRAITNEDFHPSFNVKIPSGVILQAGNGCCFYFRLSILTAISEFFANLPPPSAQDTYEGLGVIPLQDVTAAGLSLYLHIIRDIVSGVDTRHDVPVADGIFDTLLHTPSGPFYPKVFARIMEAADAGARYDTPMVVRFLLDQVESRAPHEITLAFGIAAAGNLAADMDRLSRLTTTKKDFNLLLINERAAAILDQMVPGPWRRLREIHLHRLLAIDAIQVRIRAICSDVDKWAAIRRLSSVPPISKLLEAETIDRLDSLLAERRRRLGGHCDHPKVEVELCQWLKWTSTRISES